jgi:hypothetical protein
VTLGVSSLRPAAEEETNERRPGAAAAGPVQDFVQVCREAADTAVTR